MPTISDVLPYISMLIAAVALWRNIKGDTKQDAGEMTTVIVKLETINENLREIKADIKDVKSDIDRLKERLVIVEQSTKSAHKRIDGIHEENDAETKAHEWA